MRLPLLLLLTACTSLPPTTPPPVELIYEEQAPGTDQIILGDRLELPDYCYRPIAVSEPTKVDRSEVPSVPAIPPVDKPADNKKALIVLITTILVWSAFQIFIWRSVCKKN